MYHTSLLRYAWPWELDPRYVDEAQLKVALGRKLVVMLGEEDTKTDDPVMPRSPEALAQGSNRMERGRRFFDMARTQAAAMDTDFGWQLAIVPGVGHSSRGMSRAAAATLLPGN